MALSSDTIQTLAIMWTFTWTAVTIMALRLILRKVRGQKFEVGDYLTMACIFFILARCATIHVVLIWGSNNVTKEFRAHHVFTQKEIYQREIGSKLTLVNRTFYNSYVWLQKCVVMVLYERVLGVLPWADRVMKLYWFILAATYVVIQVVTFTDCRPIYLYWQVVPDPGTCSEALGQLIILGALNIFTDVLLIIIPIPVFINIRQSLWQRLRLLGLFSLGVFLVIITIIRLPINFSHGFQQVNRTTWASVESLAAAIVANFPTLYILRNRSPNNSKNRSSRRRTTNPESPGSPPESRSEDGNSTIDLHPSHKRSKSRSGLNPTDGWPGKNGILVTKSVDLEMGGVAHLSRTLDGLDDRGQLESWDRKARKLRKIDGGTHYTAEWNKKNGESEENLTKTI
ncbi:hypothetical protein F5884DRAFT_848762 [Xylogone sp. PMI_703]|nr:hypothetical protein F5884DRAFT_848762 [Xylogone sp. PMI_703]